MGSLRLVLASVLAFMVLGSGGCSRIMQDDTNVIVVWHWMSDRDDVFKELSERYLRETGVKVRFELYAPSLGYAQKIRAAAQTKTLPDLFGVLGETKDFASFINSGFIQKLDDEMDKDNKAWRSQFFSRSLISNIFVEGNQYEVPPGTYGVPIDVANIQMLYNKKLFKKAGLDPNKPPRTWDEFLYHIDKLKENNISAFVCGWGEIWMIDCFANNYAFNIMGEQKLLDTFKGNVPYTDPDWIKVLDIFKQLKDRDALLPGTIIMDNKTAEQNFSLERAAFTFNGSWSVNVYDGMNPNLEYGVFMPPAVTNQYPMKIWGWGASSFVVNANSEKKEEIFSFLRWLTSKDIQIKLAEKLKGLPANKESLGNIDPVLAQFASNMDFTTHPSNWAVREDPRVIEVFDKGVQAILTGEKTPEQVAGEVQKEKLSLMQAGMK